MNAFSTTELERMQGAQTGAMQDTCIILQYVAGSGDYGYGQSYTTGATVVCGLNHKAREVMQDTQVVMTDAVLRLPIATAVDNLDRVKITKRFGVAVTPETYEILGAPERGPSGLVLKLRKVTDGSDA
jgi:hypothetical protein